MSTAASVSVAQMQWIDAIAIQGYHIPRLLLMEHAGQALANAVIRHIGRRVRRPAALICCGSGYNGGDGLCAAWHLTHAGWSVAVVVTSALRQLRDEPAIYANILIAQGVLMTEVTAESAIDRLKRPLSQADVIVDALLGIGLRGPVRPTTAALIRRLNNAGRPIISADVPSGLDGDTGRPMGEAIRARATVTFGLIKRGLRTPTGRRYAGRIVVDDLGIPPAAIRRGRALADRQTRHG
jgi:NAD(P)H-hydrate epimerase